MPESQHWTEEEDQTILENWPEMNVSKLARTLDRSRKDVARRLTYLRKAGHYVPYVGKKWTAKEDKVILELRPDKTTEEICRALNRTPKAVWTRVGHLRREGHDIPVKGKIDPDHPRGGLKWKEDETQYFIKNINAMGIEGMARKLLRTELAIACRVEVHRQNNDFDPEIVHQAVEMLKPYRSEKGEGSNDTPTGTKGADV